MEYISPENCKRNLDTTNDLFILDVREGYEFSICNIGFPHIPMGEISQRINELPKDKKIVLMCNSGKRAEAIGNLLETEFDFNNILIMDGGISNWKNQVDQTLQLD